MSSIYSFVFSVFTFFHSYKLYMQIVESYVFLFCHHWSPSSSHILNFLNLIWNKILCRLSRYFSKINYINPSLFGAICGAVNARFPPWKIHRIKLVKAFFLEFLKCKSLNRLFFKNVSPSYIFHFIFFGFRQMWYRGLLFLREHCYIVFFFITRRKIFFLKFQIWSILIVFFSYFSKEKKLK